MKRGTLGGRYGALVALLPALTSASLAAVSPGELLANPDRFDGQTVTVRGTVEKFREGVSPDGAPYYKFRLSDEQYAVHVFSAGRSQCRDGMQATVDGTFERVDRLGRRAVYHHVMATRVACF
jgi:hypothetical protein